MKYITITNCLQLFLIHFCINSIFAKFIKKREQNKTSRINLNFQNLNYTLLNNKQYGHGECSIMTNCFLPYGICLNETTCMCMPDYANNQFDQNKTFCNYRRKSQVVAGLLELFLPFGLGHFYVGHKLLGTIKLTYNILIYLFGCILNFKDSSKNEEFYFDLMVVCILLSLVIPIWNIVDLILFFIGSYKDGYQIELI